jgi:hypothetical protein
MSTAIDERTRPRDELLERYTEALRRRGGTGAPAEHMGDLPPGHDYRTCARCGEFASFVIDPDGGWARCEACGAEA